MQTPLLVSVPLTIHCKTWKDFSLCRGELICICTLEIFIIFFIYVNLEK